MLELVKVPNWESGPVAKLAGTAKDSSVEIGGYKHFWRQLCKVVSLAVNL